MRLYRRLSVVFFGWLGKAQTFKKLKHDLQAAGIQTMVRTYASMILFTSVLVYIAALIGLLVLFSWVSLPLGMIVIFTFIIPIFAALATFVLLFFYPAQQSRSRRHSIENNLPFAISHMASIASSGIPPDGLFELLTGFKEYKEVSRQSSLIIRNIRTFGMSSVKAIDAVARVSPSPQWKQVLNGISFTISKGGDLPQYLKQMAEKSLFDYRIKREKYLHTLSTYADIYTALLVAAPLMMLSMLGILSVIGGELIGFGIGELIAILTFVILPFLNIAFIAFIHLTSGTS